MQVDITLWMVPACPHTFPPSIRNVVAACGDVVMFVWQPDEANGVQRIVELDDGGIEIHDADLHIEYVLRIQAGHSSAANVLNPSRSISQSVRQQHNQCSGPIWPDLVVGHDLEPVVRHRPSLPVVEALPRASA